MNQDSVTGFKVSDSVHICFFRPGISFGSVIKRLPIFLAIQGTVAHIYQPDTTKFLSIQIPKWPLRYLMEEEKCFKTKAEVDQDVATKNQKLTAELKQQGF